MNYRFGFLLPLLAASGAQAQPQGGAQAALDAIAAPLTAADAPGCAIAAARGTQRLATRAFGSADLEHGIANTPDTIFEAGSVSKQFTAAAILLLAADGKLALDDDIRKFLPEMPDYGTPIRIAHLLSHTSGLRDWGAVATLGGWERGTRAYTNADVLRIVSRQRALNYAPGSEYSYTNSGYNLMALIVERVSGQTLAAFTRARIFVPLGMTNTSWRDDFRRVVPGRAIAYAPQGKGGDRRWEEDRPFENAYGNGGLLTTVGDLLIWNEALARDALAPGMTQRLQTQAILTDGHAIPYAAGLRIHQYRGQPSVSHSGSTGGYRAWLERFPAQDLSIAVLCNGASLGAPGIGRKLADALLPPPAAMPDRPDVRDARAGLAGLFVSRSTGLSLRLTATDGALASSTLPGLRGDGTGRFRSGEYALAFASTDRFTLSSPDTREMFVRAAPASPDAATLAQYAGHYASDEAAATYIVAAEGPGIRVTLADRPWLGFTLAPTYADAFEADEMIVRFRRDDRGAVAGMSIGMSRLRDMAFTRRPETAK